MTAVAADVFLLEQWHSQTGGVIERRNKIFKDFIKLGIRGRWRYHALAEDFPLSEQEKEILLCRTWPERSIAVWLKEGNLRVLFAAGNVNLTEEQLQWATGAGSRLVCGDIDAMPEAIYSILAFDAPEDVEEAREKHDQTLWVSGVYWLLDEELTIVWVDDIGTPIRQKVCHPSELEADAKLFDGLKPFETSWWTDATRVGKYATENWWE